MIVAEGATSRRAREKGPHLTMKMVKSGRFQGDLQRFPTMNDVPVTHPINLVDDVCFELLPTGRSVIAASMAHVVASVSTASTSTSISRERGTLFAFDVEPILKALSVVVGVMNVL